jgi:hypothetical protein
MDGVDDRDSNWLSSSGGIHSRPWWISIGYSGSWQASGSLAGGTRC